MLKEEINAKLITFSIPIKSSIYCRNLYIFPIIGPIIVIHIKDICQERLGGGLLEIQLLHLALHHDRLPRQLFPRS